MTFFRNFLFLSILFLFPGDSEAGHIYRLDFKIQNPHLSHALTYQLTFSLDTTLLINGFLRLKFPYKLHQNNTNEIKAEIYNYPSDSTTCEPSSSKTTISAENVSSSHNYYYFRVDKRLNNLKFYQIFIYATTTPSLPLAIPLDPLEIATVTSTDINTMIIDINPSFANIILKIDPNPTLTVNVNFLTAFDYMIYTKQYITVKLVPSMNIDNNTLFRVNFEPKTEGYLFVDDCQCFSATNECDNRKCTISATGEELFYFINETVVRDSALELKVKIQNSPKISNKNVVLKVFSQQPLSNFIFEYGSSEFSNPLTTKKIALISSITLLLHYNYDSTASATSFINYAYKQNYNSSYMAFNSMKVIFTINKYLNNKINTIVQMIFPFEDYNAIVLTGSINTNLTNYTSNRVICIRVNQALFTIRCYNVGNLLSDTKYMISFKIYFNSNYQTYSTLGAMNLIYNNLEDNSLVEFTENYNIPSFTTINNSEYNVAKTNLEKVAYHYIVSTPVSPNPTGATIDNILNSITNIGVFQSPLAQNLVFQMVPTASEWCENSADCDYGKSIKLFMSIDFSKKIQLADTFQLVYDSGVVLSDNNTLNSYEEFQEINLKCDKFEECFLLTQKNILGNVIPLGFALVNVSINLQNSVYADDSLVDFIFTLGYGSKRVSGFLYNVYVINKNSNSNLKMSFINYLFFSDTNINDCRHITTMIHLKITIDSTLKQLNPKYFSFFFDGSLENYSFREYINTNQSNPNKIDENFYKFGCTGSSKYMPFYCNTYDSTPIRTYMPDSWISMGRVDIFPNENSSIIEGDTINIYFPCTIYYNSTPKYFSLGVWNTSNQLTTVYRMRGSAVGSTNLSAFTLSKITLPPLNQTNYYYYSLDENFQMKYGLNNSTDIYSNNLANITISTGYTGNPANTLSENSGDDIGSGFTITSDYDLFVKANKTSFNGAENNECFSLIYKQNFSVKYTLFCPFDNSTNYSPSDANLGLSFQLLLFPLNWYKGFSLPNLSIMYAWSNNNGDIFTYKSENFVVNLTNPNLLAKVISIPSTKSPFLSLNVTSNIHKYICESENCFILELEFNADIISPALGKKCYFYDIYSQGYNCFFNTTAKNIKIYNISLDKNLDKSIFSSYYPFELPINLQIFLLKIEFTSSGSFSFSTNLYYNNLNGKIYTPLNPSTINLNIISEDPTFNLRNQNFSKINYNAISTFSFAYVYRGNLFQNLRFQIKFVDFPSINTNFTDCKVFQRYDQNSYYINSIYIENNLLNFSFIQNLFNYSENYFEIKCFSFQNPLKGANSKLSLALSMDDNQEIDSINYEISNTYFVNEKNFSTSSNLLKFYDYLYVPKSYIFEIYPNSFKNLSQDSLIFIYFLKIRPSKLNNKGQISCKINNVSEKCGFSDEEQALIIQPSTNYSLDSSNKFSIQLYNLQKFKGQMPNNLIFIGFISKNSNNFSEQGYLNENNAENYAYTYLDIIGMKVDDYSMGSATNLKIYLNLNSTILKENIMLYMNFPFHFDFNYSHPTNFTCYFYEKEAANPVNLVNWCYFNEKMLTMAVNITYTNYSKYTIQLENIMMPWKRDLLYSPCFEDQFLVFSSKNVAGSTVMASFDYLAFQKIHYIYCNDQCHMCSNTSENGCTYCNNSLFLLGSECVASCPAIYSEDERSRLCRMCNYTCLKCYGDEADDCATCRDTRILQLRALLDVGTCNCKDNLNDFGRFECEACYGSCLTCNEVNANNCLTCYPEMNINTIGECVCPEGKFNSSFRNCSDCYRKCKSCNPNNITNCYSCYSNHTNINGTCQCRENYSDLDYLKDCLPILTTGCHYTCNSCVGNSPGQCVDCDVTRNLTNAYCPCKDGYYDSDSDKTCEKCYRTCQTCSGLFENDCTSCLNNRIMTLDNKCVCQTGFSDLNRLDECFPILTECYNSCSSCIGPNNNECVSCIQNRTLKNSFCACDSHKYEFYASKLCLDCHTRCLECNGPSDSECLSCSGNHSFVQNFTNNSQCSCLSGTSDLDYLPFCLPLIDNSLCHPTCESCVGVSNSQCASCNSSTRFYDKGFCKCKTNLYETNQHNCSACHYTCSNCTGFMPNDCLYCQGNRGTPEHFPINGLCKCANHYIDTLLPNCEVDENINMLQTATKAAMIIAGVSLVPLYMIGFFGVIWKLVDSAQLMSYMIFINVDLPLNFADFLSNLYNFNLNTLIPNPLENLFDSDPNPASKSSNIEDQVPPLRFEMNNQSSSFLYNAATLLVIQIAVWSAIGLVFWINKNFTFKYSAGFQKLQIFLQWNFFLQIYQAGELEIYLYLVLQMRDPSFSTVFNVFSFLIMLFMLIYALIVTKEKWVQLSKKGIYEKSQETNEEFELKYCYLWEIIKTNRFITRIVRVLSSAKKFLICTFLVVAHDSPIAQISLIIVVYAFSSSYLIIFRPYEFLRRNIVAFITEAGLLILHILFLVYFASDFANETKLNLGLTMIIFLAAILFINLMDILIEVGLNIKKILSRIAACPRFLFLTKETNEEKYKEIEVSPDKSNDKSKDLSEMRVFKDQTKREVSPEDESFSEKALKKREEPSPLEKVPSDVEDLKRYEKHNENKYICKVNDYDDLARHKTSIDEVKDSQKKTEHRLSIKKVASPQDMKELDLQKVALFLNSKTGDKGYNPAQMVHLQREGVQFIQSNMKKATAGVAFQEKTQGEYLKVSNKNSPSNSENNQRNNLFVENNDNIKSFTINSNNEQNTQKTEKNLEKPPNLKISSYNPEIIVTSQEKKEKESSGKGNQISENKGTQGKTSNFDQKNVEPTRRKPNENFEEANNIAKNKLDLLKDSQISQQNTPKSAKNEGSSIILKEKTYDFKPLVKDSQTYISQEPKNKETSQEKDKSEDSQTLIKELNTIKEEPQQKTFKQNLSKPKNNNKNLTYSKSTFGLSAQGSQLNREIMGLIEELPEEEPQKSQNSSKRETIKVEKINKKAPVVQEEIVFEPLDELTKKREKKKPAINEEKFDFSKGFNFFLTEKSPGGDEKKERVHKKMNKMGVCTKDTWSKGFEFFFLTKGEEVTVLEMIDMHFKCEWKGKIGLFLENDIVLKK